MKAHPLFYLRDAGLNLIFFLALIVAPLSTFGQQDSFQIKSTSDYFYAYKGWYGHPDSVKVWIDPNFTEEQKAQIRTAMARWNAAGALPKYVEADSWEDHQVCIWRNDNLPGGGGVCNNVWVETTNGRYIAHAIIQIDTNGSLSVAEIATHELGHAQGLAHTYNAADVMRGDGNSNGQDGALSKEDKAELARARAMSLSSLTEDRAEAPAEAIPPGVPATINFDLTGYYPPEITSASVVEVFPFYDSLLTIEHTVLGEGFLEVSFTTDITHPNCTMGLIVNLYPPEPYDPVSFIGVHYINSEPVPPTAFDCPFVVYEENGNVQIDWTELCTYPFEGELRSELVVDDSMSYYNTGGGNYTIELEPGNHFFELYVDDFQVNSAYSSQFFIVTGLTDTEINQSLVEVSPNPFTEKCIISCLSDGDIRIYDLHGNLVDHMYGKINEWKPSSTMPTGVYLIRALVDGRQLERKIVYIGN